MTGIGIVEAVSGRRPEGATGNNRAFNWLLLAKFFLGWVATLVVAALTSAAFTAQVGVVQGRGWMRGRGRVGLAGRESHGVRHSTMLTLNILESSHPPNASCPSLRFPGRVRSFQDRHRPACGRQPVPQHHRQ